MLSKEATRRSLRRLPHHVEVVDGQEFRVTVVPRDWNVGKYQKAPSFNNWRGSSKTRPS